MFTNDLLVGNFGDGRINVIDPVAGGCLGQLRDTTNKPITIPGLWGLIAGNGGAGGDRNKVAVANALNGAGHTDQQTKNKRQDAKSKQSDTHPRSAGLLTAGV